MIAFTGHKRVILKSDGEMLITALKDAAKAACEVNVGSETSPVGDSQANGEIERAIRAVQGQGRTMKSVIEFNYTIGETMLSFHGRRRMPHR